MIEYTEVDVTPELAADWLAHSAVNRRHRPGKVAEFARDMAAGNWAMTGEAIKFDTADKMIDGEHRCRAVVASGATVRMVIARNVADDAQRVMDSGTSRTAADTLHIEGHPYPPLLASTARRVIAWQRSESITGVMGQVTKSEIYDFIGEHPQIKEAVEIGARYGRDNAALALPPSMVGLAAYVIAETNGFDVADEFFRAAVEKIGLRPGDPVLAMCACFQDYAVKRRHLPAQAQLSVVLRCFNARVTGAPMNVVKVKSVSKKGGFVAVPKVAVVPSAQPDHGDGGDDHHDGDEHHDGGGDDHRDGGESVQADK